MKLEHWLFYVQKEIMHESGRAHRACAQVNHLSTFVNVRNASHQCATIRQASPSVLIRRSISQTRSCTFAFPCDKQPKKWRGSAVQAVIVSQPSHEDGEEMRTPLEIVVIYF